ncbi:biotin-independent malonate decarboxylase subunit beta [Paraburkholderia rhizosphaerae]|uniref:Malonate decarboxylase beta subunit n=1 Tax=Paraburkholderia rhizosphaerae TaxID=480658 RepID=A0A4R8M0F9_9BURK|nr:biotin-independent malonate decarboxylase subunit beta [Paraburkholderia rhizosphaerae]TDY54745.1 malonate decarboxylase beta subunit [Paraburkholderia rhizosphaerae]
MNPSSPATGHAQPQAPHTSVTWYESTARQRIDGLLDAGTFTEFLGPQQRETSPHLAMFDLPTQFDDGMIVGSGRLDGKPVFVAAQEGQFMGGAFGEVHGAKLTGLLRASRDIRSIPVLLLFDTGGVRLQEANAGELAVAEIMRAVYEARLAGVPVIGLIGGRAGCFGGGGLIAACCSALAVSEQGRIGVSGPEVIETNRGIEEFDSRDRALIWRTMGGKHRWLIGGADRFVDDSIAHFRDAALELLTTHSAAGEHTLQQEQFRLEQRIDLFGECADALDVWRLMGARSPASLPELDYTSFMELGSRIRNACHDAR